MGCRPSRLSGPSDGARLLSAPRHGAVEGSLPVGQAVLFHSLDQARFALTAARRAKLALLLLTAPGAGAYLGVGWFLALLATLRPSFPTIEQQVWLDCDDAAGHALSALQQGCQRILFTGDARAATQLKDLASMGQAKILRRRPPSLDLRQLEVPSRAAPGYRFVEQRFQAWLRDPTGHLRPTRGKRDGGDAEAD